MAGCGSCPSTWRSPRKMRSSAPHRLGRSSHAHSMAGRPACFRGPGAHRRRLVPGRRTPDPLRAPWEGEPGTPGLGASRIAGGFVERPPILTASPGWTPGRGLALYGLALGPKSPYPGGGTRSPLDRQTCYNTHPSPLRSPALAGVRYPHQCGFQVARPRQPVENSYLPGDPARLVGRH